MMKLVSKTISIDRSLYDKLREASGQVSVSVVLSLLAEKWLKGEINIEVKPKETTSNE